MKKIKNFPKDGSLNISKLINILNEKKLILMFLIFKN